MEPTRITVMEVAAVNVLLNLQTINYASTYGLKYAVCSGDQNNNKYVGFWCIDYPKSRDTGSA